MFVTQENDEEEKEGEERYVNKSGRNKGIAVHANFSMKLDGVFEFLYFISRHLRVKCFYKPFTRRKVTIQP